MSALLHLRLPSKIKTCNVLLDDVLGLHLASMAQTFMAMQGSQTAAELMLDTVPSYPHGVKFSWKQADLFPIEVSKDFCHPLMCVFHVMTCVEWILLLLALTCSVDSRFSAILL